MEGKISMIDFLSLLIILLAPLGFGFFVLYIIKNFRNKQLWLEFSFTVLVSTLIFNFFIDNSNKNCSQEVLKNAKHHKIVCLKKGEKEIVLFGETHAKSPSAWSEGLKVIKNFEEIALETSNLDGIPPWLNSLAWKERAFLDFIAYEILRLKESSRETAKRENPSYHDLESFPPIKEFDEEYQKNSNLFKSYVIDKRNLRMKYNILKKVKDKKPLLVIVGRNHVKGLEKLLINEGFR